jgi:hypothetical protein
MPYATSYATIYACDPDSTVLLVIPEGIPGLAAGSRLLIDTAALEPTDGSQVAIVTESGDLVVVQNLHFQNREGPGSLPHHERIAGRVAAHFGPMPRS